MKMEEDLVPGNGWISDDSSFYGGDEDEQPRILKLCEESSPRSHWLMHARDLNAIVAEKRTMPPPQLLNPHEGSSNRWQLGESADDFLRRLPPLTTPVSKCPWIWVHNPHCDRGDDPQTSKQGEFTFRGSELLAQSSATRKQIQSQGAWQANESVTRMLNQESKLLQRRIDALAMETNVLTGKWMLFPELEDVTRLWRLVVEAVVAGKLGPSAKVASNDGSSGSRLICVYTKDYRDKEDVLRVLQELVSMGVAGTGRSIYYKSDPYTLLDIYRDSAAKYGLRASLYSSQTMLAEAEHSRSAPQIQSTHCNGFSKSPDAMDLD